MTFLHILKVAKSLYVTGRSGEIIVINTYIKNQYVYLEFLVSIFLNFSFSDETTPNVQSECQVDNSLTYNSSWTAFY